MSGKEVGIRQSSVWDKLDVVVWIVMIEQGHIGHIISSLPSSVGRARGS